ncbi:hypothetical protein HGRIS_010205 [Hohenbuehelia grisea]|uniref:Uncharacterized protein n=1 Tax=Hohenbuehelia grisea TaxID=104357 RepID=A0ABR3J470_9AGAR
MFSVSFRVRPSTSTTTFDHRQILFYTSSHSLLSLDMCLDSILGSLSLLFTTVTGNTRSAPFFGSESRPLLAANNQQPGYSAPMPVVRVTVESYDHVETSEASQSASPAPCRTLPTSNKQPLNDPSIKYLVLTSTHDPTVDITQTNPITLDPLVPDKTTEGLEMISQIARYSKTFYLSDSARSVDSLNKKQVDFEGPLPEFLQEAQPTMSVLVLTAMAQRDSNASIQVAPLEIFQRTTPSLTNLLLRHCLLHSRSALNYTVKHLRIEYGAGSSFGQTFTQTIRNSVNLESLELFEAIPSGIHQITEDIYLPNLQSLGIATKASKEDLQALQHFFKLLHARKDIGIWVVCTEPGLKLGFADQVRVMLEEWRLWMAQRYL